MGRAVFLLSSPLNGFRSQLGRSAPSIRLHSRSRCPCVVSLEQPGTSSTSVNKRIASGVQPTGSIKHSISLQKSTSTASSRPRRLIIAGFLAALTVAAIGEPSGAQNNSEDAETLSNIPQTLSATCDSPSQKNCKKLRIQRPKSRKAESCTIKCVTTCIRGGNEGPFNIIRPLVVFKQGFRSRQYCLVECSDICNLLPDDNP